MCQFPSPKAPEAQASPKLSCSIRTRPWLSIPCSPLRQRILPSVTLPNSSGSAAPGLSDLYRKALIHSRFLPHFVTACFCCQAQGGGSFPCQDCRNCTRTIPATPGILYLLFQLLRRHQGLSPRGNLERNLCGAQGRQGRHRSSWGFGLGIPDTFPVTKSPKTTPGMDTGVGGT